MTQDKNPGFFRIVLNLFTHNLGLKLLSLALAILLYHALKPTANHSNRTFHDRQIIQTPK